MADVDVVVVGAGQAGLATSYELTARGVEHVVLERATVGSSWAARWDSFALVTPNWSIRLPGGHYQGSDPHGYLPRDRIVEHLQEYAHSFGASVRTGIAVDRVTPTGSGDWYVASTAGEITSRAVVIATGAYQSAHIPRAAADLRRWLPVINSTQYRNAGSLPSGAVLIIGSGQTGCQVAEDLRLAGRRVVLACGRAPWMPRRLAGRDIFDWLMDTPFFAQGRDALPGPDALLLANVQATGARGGHDLHFRTLAAMGVELAGHLVEVSGGRARFADDLADSVAFGDARHADLSALIRADCRARGLPPPDIPEPTPFTTTGLASVPLADLGCAIVAAGYRPAYTDLVPHPQAFDSRGFPIQDDGASTVLPGLHFVGVHFLRTRASSLLVGVGDDAAVVAGNVAAALA